MNHAEVPKHQTQAEELYQAVLKEDAQLRMIDAHSPVGAVDTFAHKVDRQLARHDVKMAERAAKKDYHQNQGTYQDEALRDAIADGADVNVPEPGHEMNNEAHHRTLANSAPHGAIEQQEKPGLIRRNIPKCLAVGASTVALLGGAAGEYYAGDPVLGPRVAIEYITDHTGFAPPAATIDAMKAGLEQPTNPELDDIAADFVRALDNADKHESAKQVMDRVGSLERLDAFYAGVAAELGFHRISSLEYNARVSEASNEEEVMSILQEYTDQYGFDVVMHESTDLKDIGNGIGEGDIVLSLSELKSGAQSLMNSLSYLPIELLDYADIKQIRVVPEIDSVHQPTTGDNPVEASANMFTGIIYFEAEFFKTGDFSVVAHEIGHHLDAQLSGGYWAASRDENFTSLNPESFKYGDESDPVHDDGFIEAYQQNNPLEDKAVLFEKMLGQMDKGTIKDQDLIVQQKIAFLLARLETKIPGMGQYMLDTSY